MIETELAWAAGFFDGEGWFTAGSTKTSPNFVVGIAQKDERPITRFIRALEVEPTVYHGRLHRVMFSGEDAIYVTRLLWPWLTEPKREQAVATFRRVYANRSQRYVRLNGIYDRAAAFLGVI